MTMKPLNGTKVLVMRFWDINVGSMDLSCFFMEVLMVRLVCFSKEKRLRLTYWSHLLMSRNLLRRFSTIVVIRFLWMRASNQEISWVTRLCKDWTIQMESSSKSLWPNKWPKIPSRALLINSSLNCWNLLGFRTCLQHRGLSSIKKISSNWPNSVNRSSKINPC